MTLFTFIKQCLRREAARTEPDCAKTIQKILAETRSREERENHGKDRIDRSCGQSPVG